MCTRVSAWGSNPIPDSLRPETSWEKNFPLTPTVSVGEGESVADAIAQCDILVGTGGYCTVKLFGNPSENSITIDRSRSKRASDGTDVTSGGAVTLVGVYTNALRKIVIANLNLKGHTASEVYGIVVSGDDISEVIIRNNNIYDFDGADNAHGIAVCGSGSTPISHIKIDLNEVSNMNGFQ